MVDDEVFSTQLREDIEQAMRKEARPVRADDWNSASIVRRVMARLTYNFVRLVMGLVGFPDKA